MEDHSHCSGCVDIFCKANSCPVEYCKNGCGFSLHRCKWPEHDRHTCPEGLVGCINASFGCTELLARKNRGVHIRRCPASTVKCRFAHSRQLADTVGECALHNVATLIDEQLLTGDMSLIEESQKAGRPPCQLGVGIENDGYLALKHNIHNLSAATARGRYCASEGTRQVVFCNEIIRRDEFAAHWNRFHLEVQLNVRQVVQRCPLLLYGCTYGRENLSPAPKGTTLNYDQETDTFLALSPTNSSSGLSTGESSSQYEAEIKKKQELAMYGYGEDEEESHDVLGQLPTEILLNILQYLDSVSLWSLSQTNHYLRKACFTVVKKMGIVYFLWNREVDPTTHGVTWRPSPKVSTTYSYNYRLFTPISTYKINTKQTVPFST